MSILILNAGSSSLKFTVMDLADLHVWRQGTIELDADDPDASSDAGHVADALQRVLVEVRRRGSASSERASGEGASGESASGESASSESASGAGASGEGASGESASGESASAESTSAEARPPTIDVVAHRVVHGGATFTAPVRITPDVRAALDDLSPLAPLHNPPSLAVIDAAIAILPDVPHVAVFDTAFHATLAPEAYTYPLPHDWTSRWHLRRFGFHGLSHAYAARRAAEMLNREPDGMHVVAAHLGNGASVTAIRSGVSIDTTMGFTPLEGLMMGTRSGSVDPGLLLYLQRTCGVTADDLDRALNRESGLLGVSGVSSDMRKVMASATSGDARARLAVGIFAHRARQAIGAMAVTLGYVDALVFTGGIGEHSPEIRAAICDGLSCVGFELDAATNGTAIPDVVVSTSASRASILVIAAREDVTIARAVETLQLVHGRSLP